MRKPLASIRLSFIRKTPKNLTQLVPGLILGPYMTEKQALETIGAEVLQVCSLSWKNAWNDIRGQFNHPDHSNRIRSSLLQEHATIYGRQYLPSLGVNYVLDETQHMFVIPEKACIIFKKLDEQRRAHKNDTDRCKALFQSLLFPDMPTLVIGMLPAVNWLSYIGTYLCRPNANGIGNAWALDITDGIKAVDADQTNFITLFDETESNDTTKKPKKSKFKPKNEKDIGESSGESSSDGSPS